MRHFVLGGVRSGKSRYAETLAMQQRKSVVLVATATIGDEEMRKRVEVHRARRPASWQVIEEPIALDAIEPRLDDANSLVIVECLTLWLSNLLAAYPEDEKSLLSHIDGFVQWIESYRGDVILIASETGLGVIPANALARRFCDLAGSVHQRVAEVCEQVTLVVAGCPMPVKQITTNKEH